jgi:hypothetical protein
MGWTMGWTAACAHEEAGGVDLGVGVAYTTRAGDLKLLADGPDEIAVRLLPTNIEVLRLGAPWPDEWVGLRTRRTRHRSGNVHDCRDIVLCPVGWAIFVCRASRNRSMKVSKLNGWGAASDMSSSMAARTLCRSAITQVEDWRAMADGQRGRPS